MQPLRIELMKAAIDRYEPFLSQPIADPTPRGTGQTTTRNTAN